MHAADMIVHHLNCAAIVLPGMPPGLPPIPCHVLVLQSDDGLVLIDAAFPVVEYLDTDFPGPVHLSPVRQLEDMGFAADDVTDIDGDHIGGLFHFPRARVHVTAEEHAAAVQSDYDVAASRYNPRDWAHGPRFELYAGPGDTEVLGVTGHRVLPGVTLVPMEGHTRGHAIVVVETDEGAIVHAGDASFDSSIHGSGLGVVEFLRMLEKGTSLMPQAVESNHSVLARLAERADVTVINTHDWRLIPAGQMQS
jgi:glyoxylase-like metal-dependent hydrolase (beta-lactamase superfamily II)